MIDHSYTECSAPHRCAVCLLAAGAANFLQTSARSELGMQQPHIRGLQLEPAMLEVQSTNLSYLMERWCFFFGGGKIVPTRDVLGPTCLKEK